MTELFQALPIEGDGIFAVKLLKERGIPGLLRSISRKPQKKINNIIMRSKICSKLGAHPSESGTYFPYVSTERRVCNNAVSKFNKHNRRIDS